MKAGLDKMKEYIYIIEPNHIPEEREKRIYEKNLYLLYL